MIWSDFKFFMELVGVRWYLVLVLHFSRVQMGLRIFSYTYWPFMFPLVKYMFKSLLCFLLIFFSYEFVGILYSEYWSFVYTCYKYRLSVCSLSFPFLYSSVFWWLEFLNFNVVESCLLWFTLFIFCWRNPYPVILNTFVYIFF